MNVRDLTGSAKTSTREDRLKAKCARRNRFATSTRIRDELNWGGGGMYLIDGSTSSNCAH